MHQVVPEARINIGDSHERGSEGDTWRGLEGFWIPGRGAGNSQALQVYTCNEGGLVSFWS